MASTNTNTNSESILSTDIYEIADFYDQIRQDNIPDVDETASMVGIFGYLTEMFTQTMQNTLIVVSETSNETIPTRAKFSKNILTHALNYGITDINAKPAVMTFMICLPLSYIENSINDTNQNFMIIDEKTGDTKLVLSKDIPFVVENFEYHLDYDVIINRIKNPDGNFVYTAMYDLFEPGTTIVKQRNPISDIYNPYITTVMQARIDDVDYLGFSARLHQITYIENKINILTSNNIENKTVTFTFDDQLAAFDVDVIEDDKVTHLIPVYDGLLDYTIEDGTWCYYEYVNENTIRVKFSRDSYMPGLNSIVRINISLSSGASANFTYKDPFRTALKSEKYSNYNGMYALIQPLLDGLSSGGKDKKSIADLKKIIPREASSRGSIINTSDLHNFFNSINDNECKIFFKKKRDNPFERMYYAYMLMRKDGNVYPTNTIGLRLNQTDFVGHRSFNNLSINPGTKFYYYNHGSDVENDYATLVKPPVYDNGDDTIDYEMTINEDGEYVRIYEYISPFLITIDTDLISSYLLTVMNENKTFKFESINMNSNLQFIATNMNWRRNFYYTGEDSYTGVYDNKYYMTVKIAQNNNSEYNLIKYHVSTDNPNKKEFDDIRVKMFVVLYADETATNPYRYKEAELLDYDAGSFIYEFRFTFETNDLMDLNNRINILGVYNTKPEELQRLDGLENAHGYMKRNTYAKIYILADFGTKVGDIKDGTVTTEDSVVLYGTDGIGNRTELEAILPQKQDLIDQFLKNELYVEKDGELLNVVSIMRSNPRYIQIVKETNNDDQETSTAILKFIRNNVNSDFVQNTLLQDESVQEVLNSYAYVDLSRYTLCNVISVDNGIDFYHDYSEMMRSSVQVKHLVETDSEGNNLYQEVLRNDITGKTYKEYVPIYILNEDGNHTYRYTINRLPVIKYGYLSTEELVQDFIFYLEERRKYIKECLYVLEDTFDIDLKFFNTFGPSKTFYYTIPSSEEYKASVATKKLNVYSSTVDEDDESAIVGVLEYGQEIRITKVRGQWGYIYAPYEGWVKIADTIKKTNFVDNVAITLKFALEAQTSADKNIGEYIIRDIKEYIEDINDINELHIPNIITLITNNYREQLVYFEFLDLNHYGVSCQHLYLYERDPDIADITPEFINVAVSEDNLFLPMIDIAVY